jgi:GTP-binding protein EngB required for normal cell division
VSDGSGQLNSLSARLAALAELVEIGSARTEFDGGFSDGLLADATSLLDRAGQRLLLSSAHTVVSLAGGTGSGKSSLFNRLSGADFSSVGVTRPVTRDSHACVWGVGGSGPLLEWLGVPRRYRYARASALGSGEQSLGGLVLLDLPDHDSVMGHATDLVDHLVGRSDLIVWVLDPQKYADAAVHRRFLVPLAGHSEVIAVVLNQSDLLTAGQVEDCVHDLRRLLDTEGLHDVQILATSAVTGAGIEELRKLLIDAVSARTAMAARISADVAKLVARFQVYAGTDGPEPLGDHLDEGTEPELAAAFARAAGVSAIGDALRAARELRAMDYVGWPVKWAVERLSSPDPIRKIRLGKLWAELQDIAAGPSGAQQAEIDNALTDVSDQRVPPLPRPWSGTVRAAVRSRAADIPAALGAEVGAAMPDERFVDGWWRALGMLQGLLLGCVLVGTAWFAALMVFGVARVGSNVPGIFTGHRFIAAAVGLVAIGLIGGAVTARLGMRRVQNSTERQRELVTEEISQRMAGVAADLVIAPADFEIAEFHQFRAVVRAAAEDDYSG